MRVPRGQHFLSIVNVAESAMARESDLALRTLAGPEIGVASTKAFTTQLAVLACLAIAAARARGRIGPAEEARLVAALTEMPALIAQILDRADELKVLAERVAQARDVLYLGRGLAYPIALEGALKLKELSYLHAEGYAAGEMKHGPIALIEETVPVIVVAPPGPLFEKTASNIQEAAARGAQVILALGHGRDCARRGESGRQVRTAPGRPVCRSPALCGARALSLITRHSPRAPTSISRETWQSP